MMSVSPPTRGWTRQRHRDYHDHAGFPAHAGMDLALMPPLLASMRFPRPRGDGPRSQGTGDRSPAVSPPTRGWTPQEEIRGRSRGGFPAHAGMDRHTRGTRTGRGRFPRPRGDGPWGVGTALPADVVSPPTRGWTRARHHLGRRDLGFPAHAGMDLIRLQRVDPAPRFPRPRGDGPSCRYIMSPNFWVSPPTRGWTLPASVGCPPTFGFPAHAGMDPARARRPPAPRRFPRPRGDGPWDRTIYQMRRKVSPPTRGWTRCDATGCGDAHGFPAHAGMDPWFTAEQAAEIGFPRPRGDGPP